MKAKDFLNRLSLRLGEGVHEVTLSSVTVEDTYIDLVFEGVNSPGKAYKRLWIPDLSKSNATQTKTAQEVYEENYSILIGELVYLLTLLEPEINLDFELSRSIDSLKELKTKIEELKSKNKFYVAVEDSNGYTKIRRYNWIEVAGAEPSTLKIKVKQPEFNSDTTTETDLSFI